MWYCSTLAQAGAASAAAPHAEPPGALSTQQPLVVNRSSSFVGPLPRICRRAHYGRDFRSSSRSRARPHGPCVRGEEGLWLDREVVSRQDPIPPRGDEPPGLSVEESHTTKRQSRGAIRWYSLRDRPEAYPSALVKVLN